MWQSMKNKQKEHSSIFQMCTELLGNWAVSGTSRNSCFQSDIPNIELFSQTYVLEISEENSVQVITHMYSFYNMKDKLIWGIRIKGLLFLLPKKELLVFALDAASFF